jgi:hypothetical protein|tara:strand:+ start:875 stop:1192 length:318 start_codon:yes stop_codon:yes gene_type:complete
MKRTGPANHHAYALTGSRALEPEQHLWIAVLARALHDAFGITDYTESKRAVSWLGGNSRDFRFVCELAGREPSYVRERIQKQLTEREAYFASLQESYPYRNLSNV